MNGPAWLQRVTTWLAIVGYTLLASGLPLPIGLLVPRGTATAEGRLAAKDRTRPFPCMDKPCGCATAEQCFRSCCCHTPAERLAWARAHRVEPAVVAALERRVAAAVEPAGGCCAATAPRKPACCRSGGRDEPEAAPRLTDGAAPLSDTASPRTEPRIRTVTLRALLACGGVVTAWLAVGGALPPPRVDLGFDLPLVAVCVCDDHFAAGISAAPVAPPPRAA